MLDEHVSTIRRPSSNVTTTVNAARSSPRTSLPIEIRIGAAAIAWNRKVDRGSASRALLRKVVECALVMHL
jgi:hypothetical protein